MQVFLTILTGVVVYIIGQAMLHFVLEPIKEFNKQRGDTSYLLLFHRAKITNGNADKEIAKDIKEMGAALISTVMQIPFYGSLCWVGVFGLPNKGDVFLAAQELNGIASPVGPSEDAAIRNFKALKDIERYLNIPTSYGA